MRGKEFLCILAAACLLLFAVPLGKNEWDRLKAYQNTMEIELESPVTYDEAMKKQLQRIAEDGISCVLWAEQRHLWLENQDYERSAHADSLGIAGSLSILFPGENVLEMGDEGCCLLGKETAESLFGTTQVLGRAVTAGGKSYQVAGIIYAVGEIFVYELDPEEEGEVTELFCRYETKAEAALLRQTLSNVYGFAGEEHCSEVMRKIYSFLSEQRRLWQHC